MMPAYVIVDIDIQDPQTYEQYKALAPASIAQYGGKYLTRGGSTEVLEGDWIPKRVVILQFDSMERAKAWLNCAEYAPAKELRHKSSHTNMIVTQGL
jgi:uncharacterized protein (DUF1330 family)